MCFAWLALAASTACDGVSQPIEVEAPGVLTEPNTATVPQPKGGLPKVAILGDSIAAGLHLAAEQAFPAVMQRRLAASGVPFHLVNAGVSGDTTAGGLRRVDWLLKQAPRVVVIELGANDGMRGVPAATVESNLRAIVNKVQTAGALPLLLGVRIPPSYGAEYVRELDAVYPRIAKDMELAFVPFFMRGVAGRSELNLSDGIHPTPEGHERIANTVAGPLKALLRDEAAPPDATALPE
jgi:acyl-CoA thioesterase-1